VDKITEKILKQITPNAKDAEQEKQFIKKLLEKAKTTKTKAQEFEIVGSVSRNTHIKGNRDIDLFALFPKTMPREEFEKEGLAIGKAIFRGHKWEKAYSEHPYIRGEINGFRVEVVPAYKILDASLLQSAVDRSVFHNQYLLETLGKKEQGEARLMKQFMKGIGCYGADLSSNGFPGYVAELLILKYGSFKKSVQEAAQWKNQEVVDIENYYTLGEAKKKFNTHLIVVDPVDKNRNVAGALSYNQYARFVGACQSFLKKPSENFFFPKKHKAWPTTTLKKFLKKTELVAIETGYPKGIVEDIMWGQLRRFTKKISTLCKEQDFTIKRTGEWLEKEKNLVILLELESTGLQKAKIETGPEVFDEKNSLAFLKSKKKILSGPRIEEGRWIVETERKYTQIKPFLEELLKKLKKHEKEGIRKALSKKAKTMNENEIAAMYSKNKEFQQFLTAYLKGKEEFLDY